MSTEKDRLSSVQVMTLAAMTIIGTGLINLPRQVVEAVELGGVLLTLVAGGTVTTLSVVITLLGRRFPNKTIIEYSSDIVGPILAKGIHLLLAVYFLVGTALVLRLFSDAMKAFLLDNTPIEVIMITMLILTIYLAQNGINAVARICEAFFPIVLISSSILLILGLKNFDIKEFYSLWQVDLVDVVQNISAVTKAYLGFEVLLFAVAFMAKPKKAVICGVAGVGLTTIIYTATVAICIGVFSYDALKFQMYPTMELAKSIDFPGAFAERFDVFFAIFWIVAVFTTICVLHYLAGFTTVRLIGLKNYRPFIYLVAPIIYFLALAPQNIYQVKLCGQIFSNLGGLAVVLIPILLFIIAIIRKKGERGSEEAK